MPCFLFILLGAPYVERLRDNRTLTAALTGITAAVVGVIANLALYFAVHTLFAATHTVDAGPLTLQLPDPATLRPVPLAIAVVAAVLLFVARGRCCASSASARPRPRRRARRPARHLTRTRSPSWAPQREVVRGVPLARRCVARFAHPRCSHAWYSGIT